MFNLPIFCVINGKSINIILGRKYIVKAKILEFIKTYRGVIIEYNNNQFLCNDFWINIEDIIDIKEDKEIRKGRPNHFRKEFQIKE